MVTPSQKIGKKEIKEHLEKGYIHAVVLYEIIGSPKDHVEKAMQVFLDNINQDKNIITLKEDHEEVIAVDGGLFSAAAEVEYLILGMEKLTWLAFNFMPASIEIKAPAELTFRDKDLSQWLGDLLAKLHEVNAIHTSLKSDHDGLMRNLNAAIRNSILLALTQPSTTAEIARKVGVGETGLLPFLEALMKEKKIAHEGKKFRKI